MESLHIELALLGAIPALIAMVIVDRMDAKRPEPRATLRRVAVVGSLSAIPVILLDEVLRRAGPPGAVLEMTGIGTPSYLSVLYLSFVLAAIPEEAAKLGTMILVAWRRPEFDERMDGIVYGAQAGLGFALIENVIYLFMPQSAGEYLSMYVGRAILVVPGHAIWGAVMGYYAARRRFDGTGPGLWGGYALAVMMHGIYDAWVFGAPVAIEHGHSWLGLHVLGVPVVIASVPTVIVIGGGLWVRSLARRAIADDDAAEARG